MVLPLYFTFGVGEFAKKTFFFLWRISPSAYMFLFVSLNIFNSSSEYFLQIYFRYKEWSMSRMLLLQGLHMTAIKLIYDSLILRRLH